MLPSLAFPGNDLADAPDLFLPSCGHITGICACCTVEINAFHDDVDRLRAETEDHAGDSARCEAARPKLLANTPGYRGPVA